MELQNANIKCESSQYFNIKNVHDIRLFLQKTLEHYKMKYKMPEFAGIGIEYFLKNV